ncbi:CopD family protein [Gordonia sp. ABSL11-1]|uniref:copper resistance D family protein n=1 Tax=Gordonia sp. ABSL11-1 TaxID=3053924 RepID=UPI002573F459|nr:CopD family protein [Gordonia sp. ABSL11-1]MDL9945605.1 CopD family protein [Gordonia sp. ABSL11-1]
MSIAGGRASGRGSRIRDLTVPGALLAMLVGVGVCWVLAAPDGPEALAIPAAVAVGAAVLLVGLGSLPTVGLEPSARAIGGVGGAWLIAALVTAWMRTADQAGEAPTSVGVNQFADTIASGAPELIEFIVAGMIIVIAVLDLTERVDPPPAAYAILAGIGVLATSITGHPSQQAIGPVLIGAHALAAAWWCGTLAAMVLTVRGRAGWAAALPVFSARALWAVVVVAVSGVIAGLIEVGGLGEIIESGYGRILLAKLVGMGVLIGQGARHRMTWVPAVERHRGSEADSLRRAAIELLVMGVVLGLAVGLSTTAP